MPSLRFLFCFAALVGAFRAQDSAEILQVATKVTPPFVTKTEAGEWQGLSIDLWRLIEAELGVQSKFVEYDLQGMLDETKAGRVDVAFAAMTVTAERQESLESSHPFLESGLGIAVHGKPPGVVGAVLSRLISTEFLKAVLALISVLLICGVAVWWFERRANPDEFGGRGLRGIGEGFWFAAVTMTTVGYGDKSPKTTPGRAIALVWMFASIIVISSYTAAIASALTIERMGSSVHGPEDLPHARIATVRGSAAAQWLTARKYPFVGQLDAETAVRTLRNGAVDAVVYDAPILKYLTREDAELDVLPHILRRESYAFAMPLQTPLRKRLNRAMLGILESDAWLELRTRYLGD